MPGFIPVGRLWTGPGGMQGYDPWRRWGVAHANNVNPGNNRGIVW